MENGEMEKFKNGEMGIFYNPWKIMKLNAIPLNNAGESKQYKRMPQKVYHGNIKVLGCF